METHTRSRLVVPMPIGWRALKPRHLSISPSTCEGEIPYIDMELRNLLINFYSELAEEISDEVEGMDVKVEQGITLWIVASEIMEVITDKMLIAQSLP